MKKIIIILMFLQFIFSQFTGYNNYKSLFKGAKTLSMGNTITSKNIGPESIIGNPALIFSDNILDFKFNTTFNTLFNYYIQNYALTYNLSIGLNTGMNISQFSTGEIDIFNTSGNLIQKTSFGSSLITFALAKKIDYMQFGLSVNTLYFNNFKTAGIEGIYGDLGFLLNFKYFKIGFNWDSIVKLEGETYGFSEEYGSQNIELGVGIIIPFIMKSKIEIYPSLLINFKKVILGTEYNILDNLFSLRGGLSYSEFEQFNYFAGASFNYNLGFNKSNNNMNIELSYALKINSSFFLHLIQLDIGLKY